MKHKFGVSCNVGFEGRVFLIEEEWRTYLRRKPVRYVRRPYDSLCSVCKLPATKTTPLQHAHIIGFDMGVVSLGLTPDYLDSVDNTTTAHRHICNRKTELVLEDAIQRLLVLEICRELPGYLPVEIRNLWESVRETYVITRSGTE